jgi:hypothetical protein
MARPFAGQDFTAATTGTVTIPANAFHTYVVVTTVIDNDGFIPSDCNPEPRRRLHRFSHVQQQAPEPAVGGVDYLWRRVAHTEFVSGNVVTGNGTSTARCAHYAYKSSSFSVLQ